MEEKEIKDLLDIEDAHIKKLHQLVLDSLKEEELLSSKIFNSDDKISFPDRMADRVAEFGGSWKFIVAFFVIIVGWIFLNIYFLKSKPFDPYPFILLNLLLSCVAALQAPIIMMSQNRKEEKDRKRAENDYLVNLKAEIEIRNLHQKIDLLIAEQMQSLFNVQKFQMELLTEINSRLKKQET